MREQTDRFEGVNWRKLCLCLLKKIWIIIGAGVAGAVIGSSLYLLFEVVLAGPTQYEVEGGFYITFSEGVLDAHDHYNAYTWNSVIHQDQIMEVVMKELGSSVSELPTRSEVESMTQADILSDVRYLTITVTGEDQVLDQAVFDSMSVALHQFGQNMEEFEDISQTHCNPAAAVILPDLTWRAGFLGAVVCFLGALLIWIFLYTVDDSIYVPEDMLNRFGYSVLGIAFRQEKTSAKTKLFEERAAEELKANQSLLKKRSQDIVYVVVTDMSQLTVEVLNKIQQSEGVVLEVPFASHNGTMLTKYIQDIDQRQKEIIGVIITDADPNWMKHYYQTKTSRRKKA